MAKEIDLVLEGGGVKGLATAGAVIQLLENGYTCQRAAGTSVGAIAAALVAAGADARGLRAAMERLRLRRIPDRTIPRARGFSEGFSLLTASSLYKGDYIRNWLYDELKTLGVVTFKDLRREDKGDDANLTEEQRYKLVVMATDVSRGLLLRLPWDYAALFNRPPDDECVADAVRMSLSIPFYFRPCTLTRLPTGEPSVIVDGGVLSNFAVEIFDRTDGEKGRWPTWGVSLLPDLPEGLRAISPLLGPGFVPPMELMKQVVATAFVGHDQTHMNRPDVRDRTIEIDTTGVGITDFRLSPEERSALLEKGRAAAKTFLAGRKSE